MANRTTATLVKDIIDTDLTDDNITSYITGANTMLNSLFSGQNVGETLLTELERWVTAHLISVTKERLAKKEEAGGAKIEYQGNFTTGLSQTSYGQMAIAMDNTGILASSNSQTIEVYAVPQFTDTRSISYE